MVYHVAYDLNTPGQHYDKVIAQITQTPNRKILKSSWLVETNESPERSASELWRSRMPTTACSTPRSPVGTTVILHRNCGIG